jgi:hypothetical protein
MSKIKDLITDEPTLRTGETFRPMSAKEAIIYLQNLPKA